MKISTFALIFLLLLSLCGCSGNVPAETTAPALPEVAQPLTWTTIKQIPVANDTMTEDELRQICLDTMRLQLTFGWTPGIEISHHNGISEKTFSSGQVYGGIPFGGNSYGNIYHWMHYYDEQTGVLDLSDGTITISGISCNGVAATLTGWSRVVNSMRYTDTKDMTVKNGCLRVGPYTYDEGVTDYSQRDTFTICSDNGASAMWESYAALKPADGIVTYSGYDQSSRVCMVTAVNVVRFENGDIDGQSSTVTSMYQWPVCAAAEQTNGEVYEVQGMISNTACFQQVYDDGYIPFTFAELNKQDPVEKAEASLSASGGSVSVDALCKALLSSNYVLSDITVSVMDGQGKEVYRKDFPVTDELMPSSVQLSNAVSPDALLSFADGDHTVTVNTWVSTGERLIAYTGVLVK